MEASVILLSCLVAISLGTSVRDATFRICKNRRLESEMSSYRQAESLKGCAANFTGDYSSNSANFIEISQTCELYEDVLTQTQCDQLAPNESTTVIIKVNPCKNNQPFDGTSCRCSPRLSGPYCEQGGRKDCHGIAQSKYFDIYPDDGMGRIRVFCRGQYMIVYAAPQNGFSSEYYNKTWQEYKYGFGDMNPANAEAIGAYWLGNENMRRITNGALSYHFKYWFQHPTLYAYDYYYQFNVDSETENYTIHYNSYTGQPENQILKDGTSFSSIDRNDRTCAATNGVGYWFDHVCSKKPPLFGSYFKSGNIAHYTDFWACLRRV